MSPACSAWKPIAASTESLPDGSRLHHQPATEKWPEGELLLKNQPHAPPPGLLTLTKKSDLCFCIPRWCTPCGESGECAGFLRCPHRRPDIGALIAIAQFPPPPIVRLAECPHRPWPWNRTLEQGEPPRGWGRAGFEGSGSEKRGKRMVHPTKAGNAVALSVPPTQKSGDIKVFFAPAIPPTSRFIAAGRG